MGVLSLVCFIVAAILALLAAVPPTREWPLLSLAVAFLGAGLALGAAP